MNKKKVLILYASYGSGHKTVAKGIENHYNTKNNYDVLCIDILRYTNYFLEKLTAGFYEKFCYKIPPVLELLYRSTDYSSAKFHKLFTNKRLQKLIVDFSPDIVISTHFFSSRIIVDYKLKNILKTKLVTIVTDYVTHAQWVSIKKAEDLIVVNTKEEKENLIKKGVNSKIIKTFGIPISKKFYEVKQTKEELKEKFKINKTKPVILFLTGGSSGTTNSLKYLKTLANMKVDATILVISGTNKKVYKKVKKIKEMYKANNMKIYGFVSNMPEFYMVSDFVITKPGGATVTECLHLNKPMIIIAMNAGQEKGNYKYLVSNGFAKKTFTQIFFRKAIRDFVNEPAILNEYIKNIKQDHNDDALTELEQACNKLINID